MNVERDNDGRIIGVEMSAQEVVKRGFLHRDLRHVPIPLRDEVARHQKAYRQHIEQACREHEAEHSGRSFTSSSGGNTGAITTEMRERLDRADQLRAKRGKEKRSYEME